MTLDDAVTRIRKCGERMSGLYGKTVFDELVLICLAESKARIVNYSGSRRDEFQKNFPADLKALRAQITAVKHDVGDFEFARHASGTHFDAFIVVGHDLFL